MPGPAAERGARHPRGSLWACGSEDSASSPATRESMKLSLSLIASSAALELEKQKRHTIARASCSVACAPSHLSQLTLSGGAGAANAL